MEIIVCTGEIVPLLEKKKKRLENTAEETRRAALNGNS